MRVFTPDEVAERSNSKYLGVLVAAKFARELNALPKDAVPEGVIERKLTTRALETVVDSSIEFRLERRRRRSA
jgi:DNA-directed RNA polymerase omega subunit